MHHFSEIDEIWIGEKKIQLGSNDINTARRNNCFIIYEEPRIQESEKGKPSSLEGGFLRSKILI